MQHFYYYGRHNDKFHHNLSLLLLIQNIVNAENAVAFTEAQL